LTTSTTIARFRPLVASSFRCWVCIALPLAAQSAGAGHSPMVASAGHTLRLGTLARRSTPHARVRLPPSDEHHGGSYISAHGDWQQWPVGITSTARHKSVREIKTVSQSVPGQTRWSSTLGSGSAKVPLSSWQNRGSMTCAPLAAQCLKGGPELQASGTRAAEGQALLPAPPAQGRSGRCP